MKGLHPFRKLQQRILEETKLAARDDLIAQRRGSPATTRMSPSRPARKRQANKARQ
jgi:hypothetical protein